MTDIEVNVPLLRKAVEWAEAEAQKPPELCEWNQKTWVIPATEADAVAWGYDKPETIAEGRAPECGTCYCIAGYIVASTGGPTPYGIAVRAQEALGLTDIQSDDLFAASNTIEDVRRIAEDIAGERL